MKYFRNLILIIAFSNTAAAADTLNGIPQSDESNNFKLSIDKNKGVISLKKIKGLGVVPDSPALVLKLSNGDEQKIQMRLVSLYEKKNPTFEGIIDTMALNQAMPIVSIEFSFESEGIAHSLRWKLNQGHSKDKPFGM